MRKWREKGREKERGACKSPAVLGGASVHYSIFRNFSLGFFFLISFAHSSHTGRIHPVV